MAPNTANRRSVAKSRNGPAKENSKRNKTKGAATEPSSTASGDTKGSGSSTKVALVQTLLLSVGLALGLLYAWYSQNHGEAAVNGGPEHSTGAQSSAGGHPGRTSSDEVLTAAYTVVDIPGKGKGVVALRDIEQGERILREKPLFTVPPTITTSPVEFIKEKLSLVTEAQSQAFWNLSFVNLPQGKDPKRDLDHVALAIFETNAVRAGAEVGIFPRMARLNHGCSSGFNVVYSYRENEGALYVHAIRGVKKGEELLTSYTDTKKPRDQRRAYLRSSYGFTCTCSVCSLPEAESRASDVRLSTMAEHWGRFAKWIDGSINGIEALSLVRKIWQLSEEEGYWSERGRLAADAAWVAAGHSDADAVRKWSALAKEWFAKELGADCEQMRFTERILTRPEDHPAWGSREPLNVGGPEATRSP